MDDILDRQNRIDIVINCAGGASTRVFGENVSFEKLSIEAINWGIDVNLKGPVQTRKEMSKMTTPLGRACPPEEVVNLILYLCSDEASFITSDNYLIDGARSCGGMKHAQ